MTQDSLLVRTLTRLASATAPRPRQPVILSGVLTPPAMREHIRVERALAERSQRGYAVVAFDLGAQRGRARRRVRLLRLVLQAADAADAVGLVDARRLAWSMPLTGPDDAAQRATRVVAGLRWGKARPVPVVHAVPTRTIAGDVGRSSPLPIEGLLYRPLPGWKRTVDVVGAAVGLVVTAPIVLLAMLLVRATSRGPAIFEQQRAGLNGVPFRCFKIRSMVVDAEARKAALLPFNERRGPVFKMARDPRVTPIGRFLRATSIDELPQLWNVLRGEMSLVGPRPPTLDEVPAYECWQRRRLSVVPGITCLWQVQARGSPDFVSWVRLDLRYVQARSPWLDLLLLVVTAPVVLLRRGAH